MATARNLQITDGDENLMILKIINEDELCIEIQDSDADIDYYARFIHLNKEDAIELCKELEKFINC